MRDNNCEKNKFNSEIIESTFSTLVSSLEQNKVPFYTKSDVPSKEIRIDLKNLKLYYPQTADLIMFKHPGSVFFRFFCDETTIEQEKMYIKAFFGESYEPNKADFSKYIFIRSFAALDVNILKADEFEQYLERWSTENNGRKIVFTQFFNICSYVNIEEIMREIPEKNSGLFQEKLYYKLFIQELISVQNFINHAVKNEFLIPERSALRYFDDYGLETFFKEVSSAPFHYLADFEYKRIYIRILYKTDGGTCLTKFFIYAGEIGLAPCPKFTSQTLNDMNVPIAARFKLEKNVTDKIRQFMSEYIQQLKAEKNRNE